jgi:hypothetical protein
VRFGVVGDGRWRNAAAFQPEPAQWLDVQLTGLPDRRRGPSREHVPDSFAGNPALCTPEPWDKREQWQSEVPILWGFSAIAARD